MPDYHETRILPYTPEQVYDLVVDVNAYPDFLPWCMQAHITRVCDPSFEILGALEKNTQAQKPYDSVFYADLSIGYGMMREQFTSRVQARRPEQIDVVYLKGPMRHLSNRWVFTPAPDAACHVAFFVDFEFKNPVFQKLAGVFFHEIVRRMVRAFEQRAQILYGTGSNARMIFEQETG